jgi:DNA-binding winged helix-turn-helix (wHTH) protein/TolB-like protein/Tfp pilus assembly protein PilF
MNELYEFGEFQLEPAKRLLRRGQAPVPISNKAFDVLLALIEGRDRVLTKDELLEKVWPDTVVEENNLTVAMSGLRKALGEGANDRRYIITIPGRGYRFVADVRSLPQSDQLRQPLAEILPPTTDVSRTPTVRSTGRWRMILAIAAVLIASTAYFVGSHGRTKQSMQSIRSMAVLPFQTIGATEDEQYLGVGMADALTSKLSHLSQLTVRPTGSVLRYRQPGVNPVSAGRDLSVDAVLAGEMQRSGNRIRVTVQLVSVRDGATLWADAFDQDFTNIFAVEDSISAGASEHLALQLTETEKKGMARHVTQNPEAYQAYMKGRYFWDKDTEEPMRKSIQYFEQAIELDPNFALAYVGIADAYTDLVIQGYMAGATAFPKVKASALTALQFDPSLAEPHNSLGVVAWGYDWDWATAEKEFSRAIELNPDSAATHSNRAFYLMTMKRFDQSIGEAKRAVELNPASASLNTTVGYAYFAAQRYDDSAVWLKKALDLDPEFYFPRAVLAADYALAGKPSEALAQQAKLHDIAFAGSDPLVSAITAYASALAGDRTTAMGILARLKDLVPQRYVDPYLIAIIYSGLGNENASLDWLERAFHAHSLSVAFLNFDPFFLKFHSYQRFQELERRAGVAN